jgi:hypothetical protein
MTVHPHSGIATITVFTEGDVTFDDPRAGYGTLGCGGVEWVCVSDVVCGTSRLRLEPCSAHIDDVLNRDEDPA